MPCVNRVFYLPFICNIFHQWLEEWDHKFAITANKEWFLYALAIVKQIEAIMIFYDHTRSLYHSNSLEKIHWNSRNTKEITQTEITVPWVAANRWLPPGAEQKMNNGDKLHG